MRDDPAETGARAVRLGEIRDELERRGIRLTRKRGQNFMIDSGLLRTVARASGAREGGVVFEVGPGAGHLTRELISLGARVVAVEIDRGLAGYLRDTFATEIAGERLRLVEADVLGAEDVLNPLVTQALLEETTRPFGPRRPPMQAGSGGGDGSTAVARGANGHSDDLARVGARSFVVAANLPYNIAATFLVALAGSGLPWSGGAVVLQKEVADRLAADPGSKAYGASSVLWRLRARGRIERRVGREVFWPRPDVDSALFTIEPRPDAPEDVIAAAGDFGAFVRALFSQRRKVLRTSVARAAGGYVGGFPEEAKALAEDALAAAGVDPGTRVEQLAPEQILTIWRAAREGR